MRTAKWKLIAFVLEFLFQTRMYETAEKYAVALLAMAKEFEDDWNYGNVLHKAHLTLGHVALRRGLTDEAEDHLMRAGATPGSPLLTSFGPNMSLAKELLRLGRSDAVLKYFDRCAEFWVMGPDKLRHWKQTVISGGVPNFGVNLRC